MANLTEQQKTTLRKRRETECFPIVNRSSLWHRRLTTQQQCQLEVWYQQWLDAPETGIIPVMPDWVNQKTKPEEILI